MHVKKLGRPVGPRGRNLRMFFFVKPHGRGKLLPGLITNNPMNQEILLGWEKRKMAAASFPGIDSLSRIT
jgi:hypothetical protein